MRRRLLAAILALVLAERTAFAVWGGDPRGRSTDYAPELHSRSHRKGANDYLPHYLSEDEELGPPTAEGDIIRALVVGGRLQWQRTNNLYITGAARIGSATAPVNHAAGDATIDGILSVATDAAPASGVKAQVTGAVTVSKWFRAGSLTALTGATTDGDVVGKRIFVEDANFKLELSSSNPRMTLASNDYISYDRTNDVYSLNIAGATSVNVYAAGMRVPGYISALGNTTAPSNTTAGDGNFLRLHVGTDATFTSGKEFEVVGDVLISATLEVGTTSHLIGKITGDTGMDIAGDFLHKGSNFGVYNVGPVARQTVTGSRATDAWRTSLMNALAASGLVIDASTA